MVPQARGLKTPPPQRFSRSYRRFVRAVAGYAGSMLLATLSTTTWLLIIVIIILLFGAGGWLFRR